MLPAQGEDGGAAALTLLGSHWSWAADHWLALHTHGPVQRWGGVSDARFAWLGLLGLHQGQAADMPACAAHSRPRVKVGG
jgi:hypothetical protein